MILPAIRKAFFVLSAGLLYLVLGLLPACSKKSSGDNLPAALQKLASQDTSCICDPYIEETQWRNQVVYFTGTRAPNCLSMPLYYNSDGVQIKMDSGYTYDDFSREAKFIKEVWSCSTTIIPPKQ